MTRIVRAAALAAFIVALAVYGWRAAHSPMLDEALAEEQRYRRATAAGAAIGAEDSRLAERYWQRYPDIAGDAYFGRSGPGGPSGARDHYERHGRREGRIWGE